VLPDILHLRVQLLEGDQHLPRNFACAFDVGVLCHEESDDQVLAVRQVDQVLIVVKVDDCQLRVGFGVFGKRVTFCRLPLVWLSALMRRVVVWMNFSCCYFFSDWEKLLQMCSPSSSERMTPLMA
jgi:hypothetical protein